MVRLVIRRGYFKRMIREAESFEFIKQPNCLFGRARRVVEVGQCCFSRWRKVEDKEKSTAKIAIKYLKSLARHSE
jgi:hypothetical protein